MDRLRVVGAVLALMISVCAAALGGCASTDAAGVSAGAPSRARAISFDPPNIVILVADDLGIGDPGCYNEGSKIPTPRIDRLAAEGMRFTDVHAPAAVCTPTRYGMLTGRYCWRTDLKSGVLWNGYARAIIEPGRSTFASLARDRGYETACFGKWHLGVDWAGADGIVVTADHHDHVLFDEPLERGPIDAGFTESLIIPASLDMPPYCWIENDRVLAAPSIPDPGSERVWAGGRGFWRPGLRAPEFRFEDVLPTIAERSVGFIEERAADGKPFVLYVPFASPHTPWVPGAEFLGASEIGAYGDFVHETDDAIGRIVDALDETGLGASTLVIVTSDNGAHWPQAQIDATGHRANGEYRGQKADIYEGGHRVPFVARWPGVVPAGSESDALVGLNDLYATVADLLDAPVSADAGEDSISVVDALVGGDGRRGDLVLHSLEGMFALRDGAWKLIDGLGSGGFTGPKWREPDEGEAPGRLYDLGPDPAEETDLHAVLPAIASEMTERLRRRQREERTAETALRERETKEAIADRTPPVRAGRRPNVLVLLTDDQRHDTIGELGSREVRTPNMDRIARRGVSFSNTYVMGAAHGAVCMPSRAMLLTGRHYFNLPDSVTETWAVPPAERGRRDDVTLPELFRRAGYETFGTGKWHNGPALFARGFTRGDAIFFGGMSDHLAVPVQRFDPSGRYPGRRAATSETFSSELFSDAAIEYLRTRDREKPFMMLVSYTAPHDPRMAPEEYVAMYRPAGVALPPNFMREHPFPIGDMRIRDETLAPFPRTPGAVRAHLAAYYAMISHLDAQVGRVLAALETTGEAENTIIVLASDNGLAVGQHGLLGKQNVYEHSARVPMIISGPGIPAGESRGGLCYLHDLFPTLRDLCDLDAADEVDARSLAPLIRSPGTTVRESVLLSYSTGGEDEIDGARLPRGIMRGVREGRWKLIVSRYRERVTTQLFDLREDAWEMNDLAEDPAHAGKVAELRAELRRLMESSGDPVDPAVMGLAEQAPIPLIEGQ